MIYLDHAATSPMRREVIEAMWPYMTEAFGNASSSHEVGATAKQGLEWARQQTANVFGASPGEIIFTSGGTESDNLAIKGVALANPKGRHIVTSSIEHEAVMESCEYLVRHHDFTVTKVPVDQTGIVDREALKQALRPDTTLCSVQYANNEVGTIQPIAEIAVLCHERNVTFHTDAVQAAGMLPLDIDTDLISIAAHKFGGPKGVGALYVRNGITLEPVLHGGGQERGLRSGTSNVAGVVGLATALMIAEQNRPELVQRLCLLRDELIEKVPGQLTGHPTQRLANHASFCFPGINGETLLLELESVGITCSSGSACAAGSNEPSYVLRALGLDDDIAQTAIRFTLGDSTTTNEIATVVQALPTALARIR